MRADHLTVEELLHYATLGEIEGFDKDIARRVADHISPNEAVVALRKEVQVLREKLRSAASELHDIAYDFEDISCDS